VDLVDECGGAFEVVLWEWASIGVLIVGGREDGDGGGVYVVEGELFAADELVTLLPVRTLAFARAVECLSTSLAFTVRTDVQRSILVASYTTVFADSPFGSACF